MKNLIKKARKAILPTLILASTLMPFSEVNAQNPQNTETETVKTNSIAKQKMTIEEIVTYQLEKSLGVKLNGAKGKVAKISKHKNRTSYFYDFDSYAGNVESLPESKIEETRTYYLIPAVRKKAEKIWETLQSPENTDSYNILVKKEFEGERQTKEEFVESHATVENIDNSLFQIIIKKTGRNEADLDDKLNLTHSEITERGYIWEIANEGREYLELALAIQEEAKGKKTRIRDFYKEKMEKIGLSENDYKEVSRKKIREISFEFIHKYWPDLIK